MKHSNAHRSVLSDLLLEPNKGGRRDTIYKDERDNFSIGNGRNKF